MAGAETGVPAQDSGQRLQDPVLIESRRSEDQLMAMQDTAPSAPPAARSTTTRLRILRIGIIQAGRIVEERLVRKRENMSIGQSARHMLVVPSDALPRQWLL